MPRLRPKTRVDHIADACSSFQSALDALRSVDLRHVSGDLRECLKEARECAEQGVVVTADALQLDIPAA